MYYLKNLENLGYTENLSVAIHAAYVLKEGRVFRGYNKSTGKETYVYIHNRNRSKSIACHIAEFLVTRVIGINCSDIEVTELGASDLSKSVNISSVFMHDLILSLIYSINPVPELKGESVVLHSLEGVFSKLNQHNLVQYVLPRDVAGVLEVDKSISEPTPVKSLSRMSVPAAPYAGLFTGVCKVHTKNSESWKQYASKIKKFFDTFDMWSVIPTKAGAHTDYILAPTRITDDFMLHKVRELYGPQFDEKNLRQYTVEQSRVNESITKDSRYVCTNSFEMLDVSEKDIFDPQILDRILAEDVMKE